MTPRPTSLVRAVTLGVACAAVLTAVAPTPAHAELAPTPRLVNDVMPARALPPTPTPDAATFCPRPTGRWWDDYAVHGCIELLTGRDHTTPITDRELAWLDLGGLPAYATIDPDAIGAAIATIEQRVADEAAAQAALDAAGPRRPVPGRGPTGGPRGADATAYEAAWAVCSQSIRRSDYLGDESDWDRAVMGRRELVSARGTSMYPPAQDHEGAYAYDLAMYQCIAARLPTLTFPRPATPAERRAANPDTYEVHRDCEAQFPLPPSPPSILDAEARARFDFQAAYAQELAHNACIERRLPGTTYPPMTPAELLASDAEWLQRYREAQVREAAEADQFNPGLVAGAIAHLSAGNDSVTVGLYGDVTRVQADVRTIGEACYPRAEFNHYSTWIDGDSHRTPTFRATVTCLWIDR